MTMKNIPSIIYPYGLKPASFDRTVGPPYMKLVQVTGDMARHYIQSAYNRKTSRAKVNMFKGILQNGEWKITSDAASFLKDGRNYNGKHRLTAIAETDITAPMWVMVGADKDTAYATDVGAKKTPSHFLQMEDYELTVQYAATAKVIFYLNRQEPVSAIGSTTLTPQQIVDNAAALKAQGFEGWLARYYDKWKQGAKKVAPYRVMLGLGWYLYQKDKALTTSFLSKMLTGLGITDEMEPEYQARQRMLSIESTRSSDCYDMLAIMAKAWLLRKEGKTRIHLRVDRNYFPNIWDC